MNLVISCHVAPIILFNILSIEKKADNIISYYTLINNNQQQQLN